MGLQAYRQVLAIVSFFYIRQIIAHLAVTTANVLRDEVLPAGTLKASMPDTAFTDRNGTVHSGDYTDYSCLPQSAQGDTIGSHAPKVGSQ